ncbi:AraC family transcriptional regulator [Sphingopyxis sp.]|uniref:AraC family transcriptional regulator n=1 Tax=Sphingopyxis sp. TaxID=1908224 RepID=UPI002633DB33|nr:AraC family transcriptional regulator [Sphingopyxis sp.]MCW0200073.1 AraC family transcriptional regulator [Sphingopyxis sp.]
MAETVRAAVLTGYFPTMESLGADPLPLLREVGLSEKLLSNPEQTISRRAVTQLMERGVEVTGCITFGLRMAESRGLANLGATSLLIAHAATLRDALAALTRYRERINSKLVLQLIDIGDDILIRQDFAAGESERSRQSYDLALGVLMRLCTEVLGENWAPKLVCFTHEPPPATELPIYRRLFRCRAEFNSELNGLVLDPADIDRPSRRGDSALADHARALIESVIGPEQQSLIQQVEQSILLLMPSGRATIQTCCSLLGTSVRTLQRTLDAEGTSFSELVNRARIQLSGQYLANPCIRITDVATMLGYGSISAFSRWHVQTFGMTPKERRKPR